MSVPEPNTTLWLWLRSYLDENVWPPADEAVVKQMGEAWQSLGKALQQAADEAQRTNSEMPGVWRDVAGNIFISKAGSSITDLRSAVKAFDDMAQLCFTFAKEVANVRNGILSELALNALFFAATFAMPAASAAFWQFKILSSLATKVTALARGASAMLRPLTAAIPQSLLRAGATVGRGLGELAWEGGEEVVADLTGQWFSNLQGYQKGYDLKQTLVAGIAGVGGAGMARMIKPVGLIGALPANGLANRLGLAERSRMRDLLNESGHGFIVNGITSPVSGTVAQAAVDGKLHELTWGQLGSAIVNQGPMAGALASSRFVATHAGSALGHAAAGAIHDFGGRPLPATTAHVGGADPTGPPPPSVADAGSTMAASTSTAAVADAGANSSAIGQDRSGSLDTGGAVDARPTGAAPIGEAGPVSNFSNPQSVAPTVTQTSTGPHPGAPTTTTTASGPANPTAAPTNTATGPVNTTAGPTSTPAAPTNAATAAANNTTAPANAQTNGAAQPGSQAASTGGSTTNSPASVQTGSTQTGSTQTGSTQTGSAQTASTTTGSTQPGSQSGAGKGDANDRTTELSGTESPSEPPRPAQNGTDGPDGPIDPPPNQPGDEEAEGNPWFDSSVPFQPAESGPSRGFDRSRLLRFRRNAGRVEVGEDGQVRRVRARLREDYPGERRGQGRKERRAVKNEFGVETDSGGHYLAFRFFQNDEFHNLFPQDTNFNSEAFEDLEQEWATWTKLGYEVEVEIIPSPGSARPGEITVNYSVIDVSTAQEQVVLVSARGFVNAKGQAFIGTAEAQELAAREADGTTSLKGNDVVPTVGPDGVVNKVVATLRYLNPRFSRSMQAIGRALAAQRGAPRDAAGKLLAETFFGDAGLAALLPPGTVIDFAEYARLEQEWIAHIKNGQQVVVEITRPSAPGQPVEVTFTVTELVPPPTHQPVPPELPTFEDQIDKGPFGWFDPPSDGAPPPTAPSTPNGPPPPTSGPGDNVPAPSTDEDAQSALDSVDDQTSTDQSVGRRPSESAPPRPRRERFLPGWVMVSHQSGQLLANPSLLAVDLESVRDEGNGVYLITTSDGDRFRLIKRVGPLAPGVQLEYSVQLGRISTVGLVLSDRLLTGEVAPLLARVLAEATAWINGAVDEPQVFSPYSTPDVDAVPRLADHGDRAELRQFGLDERRSQQAGNDRRAAIQVEIRALALAMGVVDGQQDPELLRSLLSPDESAVLDRILARGQAVSDDRVGRFGYFVKAIASSGTSALVIGVAAAIFTGNPLAGLGIAAPTMVNALIGSLSERYLEGRKQAARQPAEAADREQREFDYPGLPALLDGTDPVRPPRVTPPRVTSWSDYLVRYATPSLSTVAVAGALTLFGVPALTPALVIVASGLARSLAERLFDTKKLGFRLLRTDAAERLRLADPALFTNQVVGELADLRMRLDRLRAALEVRSPGPAEPSAVTPVRPANPGAPPLKVTLTAQVIDNLSAFARWITMRPEPGVDIDPTELSQHVSAQVELLLNAFGPAIAGGLFGAFGDKYFINREEAADDARRLWARSSQEAAQVAALAEIVEPRIQKLRQLVEQLEMLTGIPPDLAARAAERSLPVVPQGPQEPRPSGQARWTAYAIQVAAAALGSAGGAVTLDVIFDMPDLSVLLTVVGAAGSLIGTPVARYLFRRAEILTADRNEHFTAALAADQRRLLAERAVSRYLAEQLAVRARQVEEQLSAPGTDQAPGGVEGRYTDHVRAALRQAELAVVPSGRPESEYDFDARAERVQGLARIDHLAAEFDRLLALGAGPELLADAQARLDFAIGLFDAIGNDDGSRVLFPALAAVDPALGQRVVGGPAAQLRAGVEQAIRRLIAEPKGKPLLLERLIALEQLEGAATAVGHHSLHGTDESRAIVQERLADAFVEASRLWQEARIPGGLVLPALSIAPGLDQVGGSVDIPVKTLPSTAPDGVLEWNHTIGNGAWSLFPPGMAPDSATLSELERTLVSLIELGYLIEVRIERVAPGTDGYRFTVRITDPGSNGPAVTEAYGPANAAELAILLNPEPTGRHHAEEAPGRHSDDFEARLRGRRPDGPTVYAPEVPGTRFVPDGRSPDSPRLTAQEALGAAATTETSDFGGLIEGRPQAVNDDTVGVRSTRHAEQQHFRVVPGSVPEGRVAATTLRAGTADDPHLVRMAPDIASDQVARAWVHEISHALQEHGRRPPRLGRLLEKPAGPTEDACVVAQVNEFRLVSRQLAEAIRTGQAETEQLLRHDLEALARSIEAHGAHPPTLSSVASSDPVVAEHQALTEFQSELRGRVRAEAERRGTSMDHEYLQFALQRVLARVFLHSPGGWMMKGGQTLLARFADARSSSDIDLVGSTDASRAQMVERYLAALAVDLGDHLRFEPAYDGELMDGSAARLRHRAYVGDQFVGEISVDLVPPNGRPMWSAPELVPFPAHIMPTGTVGETPVLRVISVKDMLAHKVSGIFVHGTRNEITRCVDCVIGAFGRWACRSGELPYRVQDLVDITFLISRLGWDASEVQEMLRREFANRRLQGEPLVVPGRFSLPNPGWHAGFAEYAARTPGLGVLNLEEALPILDAFLTPLLSQGPATGTWDPASQSWTGAEQNAPVQPGRPIQRILVVAHASGRGTGLGGLPVASAELTAALSELEDTEVTLLTVDDNGNHGSATVVRVTAGSGTARARILDLARYGWPDEVPGLPGINADAFDVIIGHARFSGPAAMLIRERWYPQARLVHVLHMQAKRYAEVQGEPQRGVEYSEREAEVVRAADLVVGVGPLLRELGEHLAAEGRRSMSFHELIPGSTVLGDVSGPRPSVDQQLNLLFTGRVGDPVKGYDDLLATIRELRGRGVPVSLRVRGVPAAEAEQRQTDADAMFGPGVVQIAPYSTDPIDLLNDFRWAHAAVMPSRIEGFGLVATEAAAHGVPVLVNEESGVARFFSDATRIPPELGEHAVVRDQGLADDQKARVALWVHAIENVRAHYEAREQAAEQMRQVLRSYTWSQAARALSEALRTSGTPAPTGEQPDSLEESGPSEDEPRAVVADQGREPVPSMPLPPNRVTDVGDDEDGQDELQGVVDQLRSGLARLAEEMSGDEK